MSDANTKDNLPAKQPDMPLAVKANASIAIHRPKEVAVYDDVEAEESEQLQQKQSALGIIRILQAGSNQVKEGMTGYIEGAREGDFLNTANNQVYAGKRGFFFIPVRQYLKYPEYIKRDKDGNGGGFLGIHEPEDPVVKKAQKERMDTIGDLFGPLPFGQTEDHKPIELVETYYVDSICILPDPDGNFPGEYGTMFEGSIAFSSSFIKAYNAWNDWKKGMTYPNPVTLAPVRPKLYTHVFHISSVPRVRGNQSWKVPLIKLGGVLPPVDQRAPDDKDYYYSKLPRESFLYQKAATLRADLMRGAVQLDFSKDVSTNEDRGSTAGNAEDTIGRGQPAEGDAAPWET